MPTARAREVVVAERLVVVGQVAVVGRVAVVGQVATALVDGQSCEMSLSIKHLAIF